MKKLLIALIFLLPLATHAQDKEEKVTVTPYGFIGFDVMHDSRQSVTARHNQVYLYPKNESLDANKNDKNDKSSFDFGAGITRLGFKIAGFDAFGAKTSAKIEGDFAGYGEGKSDYVLRLRHAFVNLSWEKSSLLVGKTWHPFFIPENSPAMVNFVVGAPIHPLARAPQLRYTLQPAKDLSVSIIALSQSDFANKGGSQLVENSDFPEMNLQIKYGSPKALFLAATVGVKNQQPVMSDDNDVITTNTISSLQAKISFRYTTPAVTFKAEGIYGGSMTNMVMLGGIARKTSNGTALNAEYLPIYVNSVWTDIHTNGKQFQFGIFGGVTNNLGTKEESEVLPGETGFTRSADIAQVYAFAPRVVFKSGNMQVGLELLHTVAAYGSDFNSKSKPIDTKNYSNDRITLGVRYNF